MATKAHCAYCFESLAAHFESCQPLSLAQVEELWEAYHATTSKSTLQEDDEDEDMPDAVARPAAISRLLNRDASSSSSSLSGASGSSTSSKNASGTSTPATSRSSLFSSLRRGREQEEQVFPLFVTWNTVSKSGHKSLRGCIGTFEPQKLEYGLRSYALTSALEDTRFHPIPASLLPSLSAHVTLLTNFSTPSKDPLDWTLGKHGLRISFTHNHRRYGATYLPDVAKEQGWTKEETLISLMRKAGWNGSSSQWQKTWREGKGELVTYEGKQIGLLYDEWREWREWVEEQGVQAKALN